MPAASADAGIPPRFPKSVIVPLAQRKACDQSPGLILRPTTWPLSLISAAPLTVSPGSTPRSRVSAVARHLQGLELGSHINPVTILFSDVAGGVRTSERAG